MELVEPVKMTEPQDGTVTAKEKGKVKTDELEHVMYTDEDGNHQPPLCGTHFVGKPKYA